MRLFFFSRAGVAQTQTNTDVAFDSNMLWHTVTNVSACTHSHSGKKKKHTQTNKLYKIFKVKTVHQHTDSSDLAECVCASQTQQRWSSDTNRSHRVALKAQYAEQNFYIFFPQKTLLKVIWVHQISYSKSRFFSKSSISVSEALFTQRNIKDLQFTRLIKVNQFTCFLFIILYAPCFTFTHQKNNNKRIWNGSGFILQFVFAVAVPLMATRCC